MNDILGKVFAYKSLGIKAGIITKKRLFVTCNEYEMLVLSSTSPYKRFFIKRDEELEELRYYWFNATERNQVSRSNFSSIKEFKKARRQEMFKMNILLNHWDEKNGTWNFRNVTFG